MTRHLAEMIMSVERRIRLNELNTQAWLSNALAGIADTPNTRLEQLLPWHWTLQIVYAQSA